MTSTPLISGLSVKFYDFALIAFVTLMYVALCAEADIYVPAFPEMIRYFDVPENSIQLILSLNFGSLCVAGMLTGPLSDSFGRRPVLLWGLGVFTLSSLGCCLVSSFQAMLFCRFLQGLGASVPMVVGAATFLDKYSEEKAGKLIGFCNSVISASMAGAPVVGAWVSQIWNWRANFFIVFFLALVTFLGTLLFIEETLLENNRKEFCLRDLVSDYRKVVLSFPFLTYSLIAASAFTAIVMYVANISVIFVNHMGMDLTIFSYWQASTMATFIVFSLLSVKIIDIKGLEFATYLGGILSLLGAFGLFLTAHLSAENVLFICLSMALIAAGGAIFSAPFVVKAMSIFPQMKGGAVAVSTALRQGVAIALVSLAEIFFDGTILPIANIIFGFALLSVVLYGVCRFSNHR